MGSAAWRLRAGILVLSGAVVVHELRYLLAGQHQDEHVHQYMGRLVPAVCALAVLAAAEFAARLASRIRSTDEPIGAGGIRWLTVSSLLVAIFMVQETAELLLVHGRVEIADSLVVHGGWLATPLSFAVGAAIALLLRGANVLLARVSGRTPRPRAAAPEPRWRLSDRAGPRIPAVACHQAGRAPPPFAN